MGALGVACLPSWREAAPRPRVLALSASGPFGGSHQPTRELVPSHFHPMWSFGTGGPSWWTPGTLSAVLVQYR